MKSDRKKELAMFSIAELKSLEMHFLEMAEKGWLIDKMSLFSYEYKKVPPCKLRFIVDILPIITAFDYPNNAEAQEYRQTCEQMGWTFATNSKQIHIFYAEKTEDMPTSIHTDNRIETNNATKACEKYELFFLFFGLACLLFGWGNVFDYSTYLSNITIALALSTVIFTVPFFWYVTFIASWYIKAKSRAKKGLPLPAVNYKVARIRNATFGISAIIALVVMLTGTTLGLIAERMPLFLTIPMLMPFVSFALGLFVRKKIDAKERSRFQNKMMFAGLLIALLVLNFALIYMVMSNLGRYTMVEQTLPQNRLVMSLNDMNIATTEKSVYYRSTASVAVPINYSYDEGNTDGSTTTEVKTATSGMIAKGIYDDLLEEEVRRNGGRLRSFAMTEMSKEEALSFGATEGYFLRNAEHYVLTMLLYDKTIVRIGCSVRDGELPIQAMKNKAARIGLAK